MAAAPLPLEDNEPDGDSAAGRMGFLDHLEELRIRIIRSCIAIAGGVALGRRVLSEGGRGEEGESQGE